MKGHRARRSPVLPTCARPLGRFRAAALAAALSCHLRPPGTESYIGPARAGLHHPSTLSNTMSAPLGSKGIATWLTAPSESVVKVTSPVAGTMLGSDVIRKTS